MTSTFMISCTSSEFEKAEESQDQNELLMKPVQGGGDGCHEEDDEAAAEDVDLELVADKNIFYGIRDNVLKKSIRGNEYVEQYYATSGIKKDYSNFGFDEFLNITLLLPDVYSAYDNMIDASYTGVIVNTELRKKLENVLADHKKLSTDAKYNAMIDKLISDSNFLENKSKAEVNEFMTVK